MKKKDYAALCKRRAARSPLPRNSVAAFLVGGAICLAGEALRRLYLLGVAEEKTAALLSTVTLVAVSAILTGVGVYDTLARVAGAGTLVPVTGFANAAQVYWPWVPVAGTVTPVFSTSLPVSASTMEDSSR